MTTQAKEQPWASVKRMAGQTQDGFSDPEDGQVVWSPVKSLWFSAHLLIALTAGVMTFSIGHVLIAAVLTVITLCFGHSVGLHRLLIHRSFECVRWVEYALVHLGVLVGMGGPYNILYMHDIRDWAQRHPRCHAFYIHRNPIWKDFIWQMHAELRLKHPPKFQIEKRVAQDVVYQWMQRTWMLQQLPLAVALYLLGGIGNVVWGISVRITVSLIGHWMVGYFTHNGGYRTWHLEGHAVQGYNLPKLSLLTMGEAWHNNHHAFPESARLGTERGQHDPGWWGLLLLARLGLVFNLKLPQDLPPRPELKSLDT